MIEKEVISRLNDLIDTCNKGIEMHPYYKELFETDKEALQTALQLLEQKDNKINKVIDHLKKINDLETDSVKRYETMYRNCEDNFYKRSYRRNIDIGNAKRSLAEIIIKILEE